MRACFSLTLIVSLGLSGCEAPGPAPPTPAEVKAAEKARLTKAQKQFTAFVEEATRGLQLLESHPDREAIEKGVSKVRAALHQASEVYPSNPTMAALGEEGRMMMRYFDACQNVAQFQAERVAKKEIPPEKAQTFIDKTCEGNATAIRQLIDRIKGRLPQ